MVNVPLPTLILTLFIGKFEFQFDGYSDLVFSDADPFRRVLSCGTSARTVWHIGHRHDRVAHRPLSSVDASFPQHYFDYYTVHCVFRGHEFEGWAGRG
eukprot:1013977-Prorocentrum_minimum.AAC.5